MAAPTLGAVGTQRTGSTASPAFAAPTGVGSTSIVIIAFFNDTAATISAFPDASWQHAPGSPVTNGTSHQLNVVWARNPAATGGTYTFTMSANVYSEGGAIRYEGCVTSGSPWDANSGTGTAKAFDGTNGTVSPAVSMTTLGADELLIHAATCWAGGTWTPPSVGGTWTKELGANVGLVTEADKAQAVAGSTGSVTASVTNSDKRSAWLGALVPAGSGTQTLTGTGIGSGEAFGSGTVTSSYTVTGTGITSAEAFGQGKITSGITGTGLGSAEAFGAGTVTTAYTITGTGVSSAETFGAGTVTPGAVSLAGSGVGSSEAFGAGTVSSGPVTVSGTGIGSQEAFGSGVVSAGGLVVAGTGLPTAETFGAGSLSVGQVQVTGVGIPSAEAFGQGHVGDAQAQLVGGVGVVSVEEFGVGWVTKLGKGVCACEDDLVFVQFGRGRVGVG